MEYIKQDMGSYQLHIIKTDEFKSVTVELIFRQSLTKESITNQNLLNRILSLSCEKYPSKVELSRACQDLYGASITASARGYGQAMAAIYRLRVLNDKYTEPNNFAKALELSSTILYQPDIEENHFKEENFEIVRAEYEASIKTLEEDKRSYALIRLFEHVGKDSLIGIRGRGYLEELEKITPDSLYQYYLNMLKHGIVDIFVIGDVDIEETKELITKNFKFDTYKPRRLPVYNELLAPRKRIRYIREQTQGKETIMAMVYLYSDLTQYDINYPLALYNVILGGGSDSLLFSEVRERNSLAYYIYSSLRILDGVGVIVGGISKEQEQKCVTLIKKAIKNLACKITDEQLEKAKEYFLSALEEIEESANEIIETYHMMELIDADDLKTRREKIEQVTKEEVLNVARKISLHTAYFLEGEDE